MQHNPIPSFLKKKKNNNPPFVIIIIKSNASNPCETSTLLATQIFYLNTPDNSVTKTSREKGEDTHRQERKKKSVSEWASKHGKGKKLNELPNVYKKHVQVVWP